MLSLRAPDVLNFYAASTQLKQCETIIKDINWTNWNITYKYLQIRSLPAPGVEPGTSCVKGTPTNSCASK